MVIYKIHKYLEEKQLNLYWVIIIVFAVASEVTILNFYYPTENDLLVGIMFLIWSLNFYIYRNLIKLKLSKK